MNIDYSVYLVTNREVCEARGRDFYEAVEEALKAGVTLVQMREKQMTTEERIAEGKKLKALCDRYGVPLLVDDDVTCAKAIGAAGVHLGQSDEALQEGRRELGKNAVIGISAHNLQEAAEAEAGGADYLGVGALYPTDTKKDATDLSLDLFRKIIRSVSIPVVGIGGIGPREYGTVIGCGAHGCAMISSILGAGNIADAVRNMKAQYEVHARKRE
jgi:thiamine-phosphate pyrophosphorylase